MRVHNATECSFVYCVAEVVARTCCVETRASRLCLLVVCLCLSKRSYRFVMYLGCLYVDIGPLGHGFSS